MELLKESHRLHQARQIPVKPYWKGRFSAVGLLVLTSFDQLHFVLKILFTVFTKQTTLMGRSTVLSLPLQLVFPAVTCCLCQTIHFKFRQYLQPTNKASKIGGLSANIIPKPLNSNKHKQTIHFIFVLIFLMCSLLQCDSLTLFKPIFSLSICT